jgi:hypothetical protein
MDHDRLDRVRRTHPTLRLLAADHMPLIASFLDRVYLAPNRRSIGHAELVAALDDHLHALRDELGDGAYPRGAKQYLDDWANGPTPWLRKFYEGASDEPWYDLTPATERAIEWLRSLEERAFVGTESRLITLFDQLRELSLRASADVEQRLATLQRRRAELDAEIARVAAGEVSVLDATQVRERYQQVEDTARRLLSDFRQVEQNFRALDAATRERIALADGSRGSLLDDVFGESDVIWASDQGRSFRAFWDYLLSPQRQAELRELVERVNALPDAAAGADPFLARVAGFLVAAAEGVFGSTNRLVAQLRRFLTDRNLLDTRRIFERIRRIERLAVAVHAAGDLPDPLTTVDAAQPTIELPLERTLHSTPRASALAALDLVEADGDPDLAALYDQHYVDEGELVERIRRALTQVGDMTLAEFVGCHPLHKGLAELVAYLSIAARGGDGFRARIDDARRERVGYVDRAGVARAVDLPEVRFTR